MRIFELIQIKRTNLPPPSPSSNRMAMVIKSAILDREIMNCLTPKDLAAILPGAVGALSPSDVRGFIYRCMTNRDIGKGLIMADRAIDLAVKMTAGGDRDACSEIIGAAVGTLSVLRESSESVMEKIDALLSHENPAVVVAVVENLSHTSDIQSFNRISDLLLTDIEDVALAAARYVEACTRDAAFRKKKSRPVIEDAAEEFLRNALLKLESIHTRLRQRKTDIGKIRQRLSILVAMMYNEILDSVDWRRARGEDVDERIYYALEEHLLDDLGPDAVPYLFRMLGHPQVEDGIKRSALLTLGRLGGRPRLRDQILAFLSDYVGDETSQDIKEVARAVQAAHGAGKAFSALSLQPSPADRCGMVPRSAGGPPRPRDRAILDGPANTPTANRSTRKP